MDIKSANYARANWDIELNKLIQNQTYNINTVTWATGTSNALYDAIENALKKAANPAYSASMNTVKIVTPTKINKTPVVKNQINNKIIPTPAPVQAPIPIQAQIPVQAPIPVPVQTNTTTKAS